MDQDGGGGEMRFSEASVVDLDAFEPQLEKGSYGLITCCSAFVLLPGEGEAILRAWSEYLSPGGMLVLDVPAPGSQLMNTFVSRAVAMYGATVVIQDWVVSEDSLRGVITGAGLRCQNVFISECYKTRDYQVDEAEETWKEMTKSPLFDISGMKHEEREGAKEAFFGHDER